MSLLFLQHRDIKAWRELSQSTHKARYERLLDQANSYVDVTPPEEHPSDSITYIGMAVANLALAYLLSQEQVYLDTARRWMRVAIGYPHWGKERMPDHDLDAAWLLFGLSLGYDWLKEALPAEERQALHDKLYLQAERLYDFAVETEGTWWSSAYWQNHNWICYAGLATAAYALDDEHPEASVWSQRALENFKTVLPLMSDDGSDYEGPVYWRYGFIWFLIYADLLKQQTNIDLHDSNFLRKAFDFRLYLSAGNLIDAANIGDCHDRRSSQSAAINYRLASLYNLGHAQALTDMFHENGEWLREGTEGLVKPGVLPEAILEFLWYDPTVTKQAIEDMPLVRAFFDMGLVSARTSWQPDATFLAFKCGSPSGHKAWNAGHAYNRKNNWQTISAGHAHPDENGFILVHGNDYLVVDEGYSKAKYSSHHSTVLVDGQGQYHEGDYNAFRDVGPAWGGRLEASLSLGARAYMRGEAARAYDPALGVRQFTRQLVFLGDLIVIHDSLRANDARAFVWQLQLDVAPEQVAEREFVVSNGDSRMHVHVLQPDAFTHDHVEEEITANPTSAKPDWIIRRMQHALLLSPQEKTTQTEFMVALNLGAYQVTRVDAQRGHVLTASRKDETQLVGFATGRDGLLHAKNLESDATWVSVHYQSNTLSAYMAGETTSLWLNERLYVTADTPIDVAYEQQQQTQIWKSKTSTTTYASFYCEQCPNDVLINGNSVSFYYHHDLNLLRLSLPAGENEIHAHG